MVILNIAYVDDDKCNGVNVVVPQHITEQQKYVFSGLWNLNPTYIDGLKNQFINIDDFGLLPDPFNKPDLVIFHEVYYFSYLKIAKYLRKNKISYIIMPHGALSKGAQRKKRLKKSIANLLFFNDYINNAVAIQYLSDKEKAESRFGKVKFIGTNGVSPPHWRMKTFVAGNI